eukprot:1161000-Pelagomonas_calceolata.AAC.3
MTASSDTHGCSHPAHQPGCDTRGPKGATVPGCELPGLPACQGGSCGRGHASTAHRAQCLCLHQREYSKE